MHNLQDLLPPMFLATCTARIPCPCASSGDGMVAFFARPWPRPIGRYDLIFANQVVKHLAYTLEQMRRLLAQLLGLDGVTLYLPGMGKRLADQLLVVGEVP